MSEHKVGGTKLKTKSLGRLRRPPFFPGSNFKTTETIQQVSSLFKAITRWVERESIRRVQSSKGYMEIKTIINPSNIRNSPSLTHGTNPLPLM